MNQYPHYLFKKAKCDAYQDEDGRWVQDGKSELRFVGMCRFEMDGRGTVLTLTDGTHVSITGIVYAPVMDKGSMQGCEVVVAYDKECTDIVCDRRVLTANYGRLNTRLFVG